MVLSAQDGSFQTFNFDQWHDLSQQEPHPESIHTISFRIRVPRVILLAVFDRLPKKDVKFTRHNIFERDHNTCQYCGGTFERKDLNLDHVIPRDRGGPTTWENIVCSLHPVQYPQSQPYAPGSRPAPHPQAAPAQVAALCANQPWPEQSRELEAFHYDPRLLERGLGEDALAGKPRRRGNSV